MAKEEGPGPLLVEFDSEQHRLLREEAKVWLDKSNGRSIPVERVIHEIVGAYMNNDLVRVAVRSFILNEGAKEEANEARSPALVTLQ